MSLELKLVTVQKPAEVNLILGQSHFIKTVEDLFEAVVASVPGVEFGLAFCEASGACLIRAEGTDDAMKALAIEAAQAIGAGHCFVIMLKNAFPINVLGAVKACPEVAGIYCATANPLQVVVAETETGSGDSRGDRRLFAEGRGGRGRDRLAAGYPEEARLQALVRRRAARIHLAPQYTLFVPVGIFCSDRVPALNPPYCPLWVLCLMPTVRACGRVSPLHENWRFRRGPQLFSREAVSVSKRLSGPMQWRVRMSADRIRSFLETYSTRWRWLSVELLVLSLAVMPVPALSQGVWTPTSTSSAPQGRLGATAVWTGSKIIVWAEAVRHPS